jgi:hypothetical protein
MEGKRCEVERQGLITCGDVGYLDGGKTTPAMVDQEEPGTSHGLAPCIRAE